MKEISRRLAGLSEKQRAQLQRALLSTSSSSGPGTFEPLAIIGMACRFPGGPNPAAFWNLLSQRGDAIREVPPDRWVAEDWYNADPQAPGKMITRWGGFLEGVEQFDAGFFGISPREAIDMDPQQRLLLEVAWETIEDAGLTQERLQGSRTGVFIGISTPDYFLHSPPAARSVTPYVGTGSALSIVANRLSYLLDLRGPSLVVDTACSSSLVAFHLACRSLHDQDCEIALVGGVNLVLSPTWNLAFSKFGFMSADGRCKAFDSRADGYVRGEGCGMIAVKRLSDAQAAGDAVLAVIRGSAVNQDGRTASLTAPNVLAQKGVIRAALERADVAASEISYIEAHGTGTPLGDPIEIEALADVFNLPGLQKDSVAIGSVKGNIGHLESAAGIAALIKVVLSLQKECIPPQPHFKKLNPNISLEHTPFLIPTKSLPWPARARHRYAGISSFGFGGTNAHVVLEEAPEAGGEEKTAAGEASMHILPLSARSAPALKALAKSYVEYLKTSPAPPDLICYNASVRRSHHRHRVAVTGKDAQELIGELEQWTGRAGAETAVETTTRRPLVFVFTGQGAPWQQMAGILQDEPVYQQTLRACDEVLGRYAGWSLVEQLRAAEADNSRWEQTAFAQPAICAQQLALVALWKSWGIEPDAVVGHSVGEVAAAQVAGVISLEQAMRIVYHRGASDAGRQRPGEDGGGGTVVEGGADGDIAVRGSAVGGGKQQSASNGDFGRDGSAGRSGAIAGATGGADPHAGGGLCVSQRADGAIPG
jgi:acyl transferase domain-containing protein